MTEAQTKRRNARRKQRGMTLIEIMVVVTILGMIAAAVTVAVIPKLNEAKQDTAATDIRAVQSALKLYYTKHGKYPDTGAGLKALVDSNDLERMPMDPWGHEYVYVLENGKPTITSYGADGAPGGDGADKDISSKDLDAPAPSK